MGERKKKKKWSKQLGSAITAGGAPIQTGVKQKGRGMTDAAGSKVTLRGAGRSRRTVRGGAVSMGRGARGHGSCEEGRTWRFRKTK